MKISEYFLIKARMEQAQMILSDKKAAEMKAQHCQDIIDGKKCVYVAKRDSRRFPTPEEVEEARGLLASYNQQIKVLDIQFAEV